MESSQGNFRPTGSTAAVPTAAQTVRRRLARGGATSKPARIWEEKRGPGGLRRQGFRGRQTRRKTIGSPAWIRTTIHGSKGRCPTIRRPGNLLRKTAPFQCSVPGAGIATQSCYNRLGTSPEASLGRCWARASNPLCDTLCRRWVQPPLASATGYPARLNARFCVAPDSSQSGRLTSPLWFDVPCLQERRCRTEPERQPLCPNSRREPPPGCGRSIASGATSTRRDLKPGRPAYSLDEG
jgi:hypothetical protein